MAQQRLSSVGPSNIVALCNPGFIVVLATTRTSVNLSDVWSQVLPSFHLANSCLSGVAGSRTQKLPSTFPPLFPTAPGPPLCSADAPNAGSSTAAHASWFSTLFFVCPLQFKKGDKVMALTLGYMKAPDGECLGGSCGRFHISCSASPRKLQQSSSYCYITPLWLLTISSTSSQLH